MLTDSHCHLDRLDLSAFGGNLAGVLAAAAAQGVSRMLSVATDLQSWPALAQMTAPYPNIALSVGVHPNEAAPFAPTLETLLTLGATARVVAVGETGLDYYRGSSEQRQRQQHWLRLHIAAARQLRKPLIIHTREASADTLRILAEEGAAEVGGVVHCFTEDWAVAEQALALNFHISLSGIVTFKTARAIQEVAQRVPAERLLLETDAPYLAPVPQRGKANHPAWVRYTAEFVAKLRGSTWEELAALTTANYLRLFAIEEIA